MAGPSGGQAGAAPAHGARRAANARPPAAAPTQSRRQGRSRHASSRLSPPLPPHPALRTRPNAHGMRPRAPRSPEAARRCAARSGGPCPGSGDQSRRKKARRAGEMGGVGDGRRGMGAQQWRRRTPRGRPNIPRRRRVARQLAVHAVAPACRRHGGGRKRHLVADAGKGQATGQGNDDLRGRRAAARGGVGDWGGRTARREAAGGAWRRRWGCKGRTLAQPTSMASAEAGLRGGGGWGVGPARAVTEERARARHRRPPWGRPTPSFNSRQSQKGIAPSKTRQTSPPRRCGRSQGDGRRSAARQQRGGQCGRGSRAGACEPVRRWGLLPPPATS